MLRPTDPLVGEAPKGRMQQLTAAYGANVHPRDCRADLLHGLHLVFRQAVRLPVRTFDHINGADLTDRTRETFTPLGHDDVHPLQRVQHFHPPLQRLKQRVSSFDIFVRGHGDYQGKIGRAGMLRSRPDVSDVAVVERVKCSAREDSGARLDEFPYRWKRLDDHLRSPPVLVLLVSDVCLSSAQIPLPHLYRHSDAYSSTSRATPGCNLALTYQVPVSPDFRAPGTSFRTEESTQSGRGQPRADAWRTRRIGGRGRGYSGESCRTSRPRPSRRTEISIAPS